MEASKANCINRLYGAGDGNRTHVRSLGSLQFSSKNAGLAAFLRFSERLNWKIMENENARRADGAAASHGFRPYRARPELIVTTSVFFSTKWSTVCWIIS